MRYSREGNEHTADGQRGQQVRQVPMYSRMHSVCKKIHLTTGLYTLFRSAVSSPLVEKGGDWRDCNCFGTVPSIGMCKATKDPEMYIDVMSL